MKTALSIVTALAEWSRKYPREKIYHMASKEKMDGELIEIEKAAVEYMRKVHERLNGNSCGRKNVL